MPAFAAELLHSLTDRRALGRTCARAQARGAAHPYALGRGWARDEQFSQALDEDGAPLAVSCWDICVAFAHELHLNGVHAGVRLARPAEEGATDEPHAVVTFSVDFGQTYIADPYFSVPALALAEGATSTYSSFAVEASLISDAQRTRAWLTGEAKRPLLLRLKHRAHAKQFEYAVGEEELGLVQFQAHILQAPSWIGAEGQRVMRMSIDEVQLRLHELPSTFLLQVWAPDELVDKYEFESWAAATEAVRALQRLPAKSVTGGEAKRVLGGLR